MVWQSIIDRSFPEDVVGRPKTNQSDEGEGETSQSVVLCSVFNKNVWMAI